MGVAIGCIGMSLDDFLRCYVDEFRAICAAWSRMRDGDSRDSWERMRISASIGISPHVSESLSPAELLPLPWDSEKRDTVGEERESGGADTRKMTPAERRDWMKRMAEKSGYGV